MFVKFAEMSRFYCSLFLGAFACFSGTKMQKQNYCLLFFIAFCMFQWRQNAKRRTPVKEGIIIILYSFLSESKNVTSAVDLRNASEKYSAKSLNILNSVKNLQ